jgi:DNA-binding NtrC family response regulator
MEPTPESNLRTILVVDDDPDILVVVVAMLGHGVYNILTADSGSQAMEQSRAFKGDIHLLLSDFQMPQLSGMALASAMTADRPDLKVLLMSAFEGGMLVLNEGWHFLPKPFIASQLRALVHGLASPDVRSERFAK